ncbi:hypothetical protein HN51_012422 [Arachis hypogaea]
MRNLKFNLFSVLVSIVKPLKNAFSFFLSSEMVEDPSIPMDCNSITISSMNSLAVVSPSQFEVHVGWASRRKLYAYIYTSDGMSLHELAMFILKERKYTAKYNDDLCVVCWDGGTCCSVMDAQGRFTKNVRQYQVFLVVIGIVKSAKTCSKEKVLLQTMSMLWQQKGLKELVPLNRLPDIALKAPVAL